MKININLKPLRQEKGISQDKLARELDMTPSNLRAIEGKKAKSISFETLAKLCEVLECEPNDLLKLE
ncbi:MAG TPA: helix-turn-helix domain-containing protein, partial [Allocoleopsis sp.]